MGRGGVGGDAALVQLKVNKTSKMNVNGKFLKKKKHNAMYSEIK